MDVDENQHTAVGSMEDFFLVVLTRTHTQQHRFVSYLWDVMCSPENQFKSLFFSNPLCWDESGTRGMHNETLVAGRD